MSLGACICAMAQRDIPFHILWLQVHGSEKQNIFVGLLMVDFGEIRAEYLPLNKLWTGINFAIG